MHEAVIVEKYGQAISSFSPVAGVVTTFFDNVLARRKRLALGLISPSVRRT